MIKELYVSCTGDDKNDGSLLSPLKTLEYAVELSRKKCIKKIYIREGKYFIEKPILLGVEDNALSISSFKGEKVVLSGAKTLSDLRWDCYEYNEKIKVTTLEKGLKIDKLFVDGKEQIMARFPNYKEGVLPLGGVTNVKEIKHRSGNYKNPSSGYIRAIHSSGWGGNDYYITGKNEDSEIGLDLEWIGDNNRGSRYDPNAIVIENVFEELDDEKEWFYDKETGKLYYYPEDNVNLDKCIVSISMSTGIFKIVSDDFNNPVKDISISGLELSNTSRSMFATHEKGMEYISMLRGDWSVSKTGVIYIENGKNIKLTKLVFNDIGGNGIFCYGYNEGHLFDDIEIINAGASGIQIVGSPSALDDPTFFEHSFYPDHQTESTKIKHADVVGPVSENYPRDISISNTHIYNVGIFEKQSTGVNLSVSSRIRILHCTIHKSSRSCININDGSFGGHEVAYNDIFDAQFETTDHGPFNSWGRDRYWSVPCFSGCGENGKVIRDYNGVDISKLDAYQKTTIHNNRFYHNIKNGHSWGVDLDDGSTNYEIYNNLILGIGIKLREGFDRIVHNNIIVNGRVEIHVPYELAKDRIYSNLFVGDCPWGFAGCDEARFLTTKDYVDKNWYFNFSKRINLPSWSFFNNSEMIYDKGGILGDNPDFVDIMNNDYTIQNKAAMALVGIENIPMDSFGKPDCEFKSPVLAKEVVNFTHKEVDKREWKGAIISNIDDSIMSSTGFHGYSGVYFEKIPNDSVASKIGFKERDILLSLNKIEIQSISNIESADYSSNIFESKVFRRGKTIQIK